MNTSTGRLIPPELEAAAGIWDDFPDRSQPEILAEER